MGRPGCVVGLLLAGALLAACDGDGGRIGPAPLSSTARNSPSVQQSFTSPTDEDCRPPSPQTTSSLAEVKGTRLWALVFGAMPLKAATNTKIVWRMSGHGAFQIAAKTTDGTGASMSFGPEPHQSSTWNVPNTDEWGTGFIFPKAGCWRVHAYRDDLAGDVYFLVVQA